MENNQHIVGIYNWCDRWCERCALTHRCRLYEQEQRDDRELTSTSHDMDTTMKIVGKSLQDAIALLQKIADENEIDLNLTEEELLSFQEDHEEKRKSAKNHILLKLTDSYLEQSQAWLKTSVIKERKKRIQQELDLGIIDRKDCEKELLTVGECLSVIRWYQIFIPSKCNRALMGKSDGFEVDLLESEKDSNGTAKIARIAMERSIRSWAAILEFLPEQEDKLFIILSLLQQMIKSLDQEFPFKDLFMRPGFDQ